MRQTEKSRLAMSTFRDLRQGGIVESFARNSKQIARPLEMQ